MLRFLRKQSRLWYSFCQIFPELILMEKKHWFVPKSYGWGLAPICWQGWVVTLVYIGLLLLYVWYGYDVFSNPEAITAGDVIKMIFDIFISGVIFVYMMEGKTEGKVRWYWGNMNKD